MTTSTQTFRPQDDLFRAINHEWLITHEIPADRPSDGAFYQLRDNALLQVREIVETLDKNSAATGSEEQQIIDLYASFMDTARIEELGIAPIASFFSQIDAAQSIDDIILLSGKFSVQGVSSLIGAYVATDSKKITHNALYFGQSGLSLPDESYYKEEQFAPIRTAFVQHVEKMFHLAQLDEPATQAHNILDLETAIAQIHWNRVDRRDADKTYNKYSWEQFIALVPELPLAQWAANSGIHTPPNDVVISEPSFITGLSNVLSNSTLEQWKSWLRWQVLTSFAAYLHEAFVQENFSFFGTVLSGTTEIKERWKRGISVLESALGFAVGQKYVAKHFPTDAKDAISALVDNLIKAYHKNISELDWMTEETKVKALEKLAQFTPKIGYPEVWKTYAGLKISSDDLVGNIIRSSEYETARAIAKIDQPVDRAEWLMTPQTVNAYYYPEQNEIVFPAAILQPPFFDPAGDAAANYGGIGAVIGHEIGHGFDDQGAKYDGTGALNNWWTEADTQEFTARTKKLITQFDAYEPQDLPGQHVNGALTVGENIGDLGGLSIAIVAFELAQGRSLTQDELQRVFESWALIWRSKARKEYQEMLLTVDPHSPAEFRCNGTIRNIDAFYTAFAVQTEDALYLAPEERVYIW